MSVKVNLLPRELAETVRERRLVNLTIVGVLAFVVLLSLLYVLKLLDVNAAREDRDIAQAEVTRLEARVAELEQFRVLADELENRNTLLATAMAGEVSWSRILNDLSLTFPANSSLRALSGSTAALDPAGTPVATSGIGNLTFNGYSVEEYAPGVESVLIEFDKVQAFFNVFLSTAAQEEIGGTEVTTFDGTVLLDEDARTGRYEQGLPAGEAP
jgi:Tfp pilus assembly protein PilN